MHPSLAYLHAVTRGKQEHLLHLVSVFLDSVPNLCADLVAEIEQHNTVQEDARKLVHKLTPNLQAMHMTKTANLMQHWTLGKAVSKEELSHFNQQFQSELKAFMLQLNETYGSGFMQKLKEAPLMRQ